MPVVQDQPPGSLSASSPPVTGTNPGPVGSPAASGAPAPGPTATPVSAALQVPSGFSASVIANVSGARELAALPNGDLIVGTNGNNVAIVPGAEAPGAVAKPAIFATLSDSPAQGVAFGSGSVFVATQHAVWRIPYTNGAQNGTAQKIASLRTGPVAPNSDGDLHTSSSVAVSGTTLYVGVGSSCNACAEVDPTRATVQKMGIDGSGMTTQAKRYRNAIALATDPMSGTVWAGDAGQDSLPAGHPYEFLDPVSSRTAPADYGWPACEENHVAYTSGADCSNVVVPALEFPAYSTIIGATFYPANQGGTYAFPAAWSGGMYVSMHGSWHQSGNGYAVPPHVAFVPFSGSSPARPVTWSDPTTQWKDFFTGFQQGTSRVGHTTGVAVGASGSLFVADDQTGNIYRIRPAGVSPSGASKKHR
jgi:glucose/arabinose dehydrogenase